MARGIVEPSALGQASQDEELLLADEAPPQPEQARVNAAFLATLIAQTVQAEPSRRRRRASPDVAISLYRPGDALTEAPAQIRLRSL